jgi:hypothetical protein
MSDPLKIIRALRISSALALIVSSLAFTAVGCGAPEESDGTVGVESVQCPSVAAWAPGTTYKVGQQVSFDGKVFTCRQAHTAFDPGWTPVAVPALWSELKCDANGAAPPPAQPPAPPVVNNPPPAPPVVNNPPPPPANNGGQCVGGPKFDPAGVKNVGNGRGLQFIGGQCLRTADCASGCCAFPCGICSGPGAQFQAGKKGCGFGG